MRRVLSLLVAILGACLALAGACRLDATQRPGRGYALLLAGALLLILLPERQAPDGEPRRARPSWASIGVLLVAGLGIALRVTRSVLSGDGLSGGTQLGLWFISGLLFAAAFHLWDLRREEPRPRLFASADLWWMLGLFLLAAGARVVNLAVEPPGLAPDELWPLEHTLRLTDGPGRSGFTVDDMSMNGLFHHINLTSIKWAGGLGFDMVQSAKLPGAIFGALSVALLYGTVRLLGSQALAATAGVFLLWQGLHWSLSRFYYLYAGDLLWISLASLLLVAGLKSRRLSLLAAAGFISAVAMSWPKIALLVGPWAAIVLADHALIGRGRGPKRWLPASVWLATFAVAMLPAVAEVKVRLRAFFFRASEVSRLRKIELQRQGMSSVEAYGRGLWSSARVLQVEEQHLGRYPIRRGKPSLDPVASAMATIGLIACGLWFVKDRGARLCLLGLLLFASIAIASYPTEPEANIVASRYLAGATLFIAWLAAYGASVVAKRLAPERRRLTLMLGIACASLLLNVYYIRAFHGREPHLWYEDMGVNRVYVLRALRQAAEFGPVYFRPVHNTQWVKSGLVDLPNVSLVSSPQEVRDGLTKNSGRMCSVLLPWPGPEDPTDSAEWVPALSDVISTASWEPGPPDLEGIPIYRIAHVRVPLPIAEDGTAPSHPREKSSRDRAGLAAPGKH